MNETSDRVRQIQPRMALRRSGGWLAATPPGAAICIGVVGPTESDARERFAEALEIWAKSFEEEKPII